MTTINTIRNIFYSLFILNAGNFLGQEMTLSHKNGYHGEIFTLIATCPNCSEIKYSLDGSDPSTGEILKNQLIISNALIPQEKIALKPTTAIPNTSNNVEWHTWKPPGHYDRAIAIKVAGYKDNQRITDMHYRTFFFEENWDNFPTSSLFINVNDFYNDTVGISVPGIHAEPNNSVWTGNYHKKGHNWEKEIHWTFLRKGKTKQDKNLGVRIHGLKTGSAPQKSFRLYARNKYGSKSIKYKFNNNSKKKHKRILLRSLYSGHSSRLINDVVAHELSRPLDLEIMDYGFSRTYINGEYWGLHIIRERVDEKYLSEHFNCNEDSILIPGNYNQAEFQELFDFIDSHKMSLDENLSSFGKLIDLSNFTDYVICETFFSNQDWLLQNNNITFWKEKGKGKWRLVLIDIDAGFQHPEDNMFEFMQLHKESMITKIFNALMTNKNYQTDFTNRYAELLNTYLSPTRCFKIIDSISNIIAPHVPAHIDRWGHPTSTFAWNKDLDNMRSFVNDRATIISSEISNSLQLNTSNFGTVKTVHFISQDQKLIALVLIVLGIMFSVIIRIRKRTKLRNVKKSGLT